MSKPKLFPGPAEFFVEGSLYVQYLLDNSKQAYELNTFNGPFACYCVDCRRPSVFHHASSPPTGDVQTRYYKCTWSSKHEIFFSYQIWTETPEKSIEELEEIQRMLDAGERIPVAPETHVAMKVGQWPSLADLAVERIGRYRSILSDKQYREFNKGVGLHAHDVGIGSFVYLRRVFEDLVDEARTKAKLNSGWDDDLFQRSHMEENIKLLSSYLPRTLVENRKMYSILSVGIHELEEEQCAALFPVIRNGIEMILDEKIAESERTRKETESRRAIDEAVSKLGGKPPRT